jgi:hypothetical protein
VLIVTAVWLSLLCLGSVLLSESVTVVWLLENSIVIMTDCRVLNCWKWMKNSWASYMLLLWQKSEWLSVIEWVSEWVWRMLSSGMLHCVALVRTDIPPKHRFLQEPQGIISKKTAFFIILHCFQLQFFYIYDWFPTIINGSWNISFSCIWSHTIFVRQSVFLFLFLTF